jgi:hypothetical protein
MSIPSIIDFFPGISGLTGESYTILNPALKIMVSNYSALESNEPLPYDISHDKFLEIVKNFDSASRFLTPAIISSEAWINHMTAESLKIPDILNNKGDS